MTSQITYALKNKTMARPKRVLKRKPPVKRNAAGKKMINLIDVIKRKNDVKSKGEGYRDLTKGRHVTGRKRRKEKMMKSVQTHIELTTKNANRDEARKKVKQICDTQPYKWRKNSKDKWLKDSRKQAQPGKNSYAYCQPRTKYRDGIGHKFYTLKTKTFPGKRKSKKKARKDKEVAQKIR